MQIECREMLIIYKRRSYYKAKKNLMMQNRCPTNDLDVETYNLQSCVGRGADVGC